MSRLRRGRVVTGPGRGTGPGRREVLLRGRTAPSLRPEAQNSGGGPTLLHESGSSRRTRRLTSEPLQALPRRPGRTVSGDGTDAESEAAWARIIRGVRRDGERPGRASLPAPLTFPGKTAQVPARKNSSGLFHRPANVWWGISCHAGQGVRELTGGQPGPLEREGCKRFKPPGRSRPPT
mgnify:CR=1 FL=1